MDEMRLADLVPDGEDLRYSGSLRRGGRVGVTDRRLLVVTDTDSAPKSVELRNVESVDFTDFDWFLAVLSLLLVGFGAVSTTRNVLGGVAFVVAGLASLGVTYRKRGKAVVRMHTDVPPLELYPGDASAFYDALKRALELTRARIDEDGGETSTGTEQSATPEEG